MAKLTKHEILDAVAANYTTRNRSVCEIGGHQSCKYCHPDGEKECAFAFFVAPEHKQKLIALEGKSIVDVDNSVDGGIDSILREDVHGYSVDFWQRVQTLHDVESNWDINGLSEEGKKRLETLKRLAN